MDQAKMKALYKKMVEPNIKRFPNGLIALPVGKLNQYHTEVGYADKNKVSVFNLILPGAKVGEYDYHLGPESDSDAVVTIMNVFYYDYDTEACEELMPNKTLEEAIYRHFYEGEVDFNGVLRIDQEGRIWADAMAEDNIGVTFLIALSPKGIGYELISSDETVRCQIWFDGSTFYYEQKSLLDAGRAPS